MDPRHYPPPHAAQRRREGPAGAGGRPCPSFLKSSGAPMMAGSTAAPACHHDGPLPAAHDGAALRRLFSCAFTDRSPARRLTPQLVCARLLRELAHSSDCAAVMRQREPVLQPQITAKSASGPGVFCRPCFVLIGCLAALRHFGRY